MNEKQFADCLYNVVKDVVKNDKRFVVAKSYYEPETASPRYNILVIRENGECSIRIVNIQVFNAQLGWGYKYYERKWVRNEGRYEPCDYGVVLIDNYHRLIRGNLAQMQNAVRADLEKRMALFS